MEHEAPSLTIAVGPLANMYALTQTSRLLTEITESEVAVKPGPLLAGPNEYLRLVLDVFTLHDLAKWIAQGTVTALAGLATARLVSFTKRQFRRLTSMERQAAFPNSDQVTLDVITKAVTAQQAVGQFLIAVGNSTLAVPTLAGLSEAQAVQKIADAFLAAAILAEELAAKNLSAHHFGPEWPHVNDDVSTAVVLHENGNAEILISLGAKNDDPAQGPDLAKLLYDAATGECSIVPVEE
ncbi:hypothetical protein KFK14_03940 [Sphingobium phenoxybenzoativorans]|uniref:Uncharacterized protein n=1 Tax=Sphingobium phenoxybenzoativorans TaxID=1592790 RepID=A0A975Q2M4_9SPHN|nr:hypothetical protein [Sphingobium phenoxybenzoativorans]QUT06612.1 hypothetical protein KFK14_03940 [Sphingobium phenoxybenzoativorans]